MIERVAGLEHRGCSNTALDQGSTLRLLDRLQSDCPIHRLTTGYDLGGVVLGDCLWTIAKVLMLFYLIVDNYTGVVAIPLACRQ